MDYTFTTPKEWADTSVTALAEKNLEVVEREHWRRFFAASAIQSGSSCKDAVAIADEMLKLLRIDGR